MTIPQVDFYTPETLTDPYPLYRRWQAESPILRTVLPGQKREVFLVISYALAKEALTRNDLYSSEFEHVLMGGARPNPEVDAIAGEGFRAGPLLLNLDEPAHRRYRALFNPIFSPRQVAQLSAGMEEIVDNLIDAVSERGECDFINEVAVPFPLYVICDLLGFDRALYPKVKAWGDAVLRRVGQQESDAEEVATMREILEFHGFLRAQIADRRVHPGEDVITRIIEARVAGIDPLTDTEALLFSQELTVAGNETTRNTLIGGTAMLLQQPVLADRLRADPSLVPGAVEEMLRLFTPVAGTWRIALADTELGGVAIPKGAVVNVRMEAANRDPAQFPDPERLDPQRDNRNTHLSFSTGVHYCLGNLLARRELDVAVRKILARFHGARLIPDRTDLRRPPSVMLRGTNAMHIRFETEAARRRVPA